MPVAIPQPVMQNQSSFLYRSLMVYYTIENHLLFSDSLLEHWLLRYPQNSGFGGISLRDPASAPRQNNCRSPVAHPNIARTADFV